MKTSIEFLEGIKIKSAIVAGIIGASIPLSCLSFIVLTKEDLFESWMLVPLTFIPFGGILGGIFFYLMGFIWFPTGGRKLAAIIFSVLMYFIALWMSSVLAFSVTGHWD
ncbi:hypothetical protein [Algoriphagus persicinus]|uniref:hypothetical protein n=1 Tax=Algoriphagus persicinus TaxID=3108754 RepID=UPI002B3FA68A|nr:MULTISPECIES: hypothetical protein [unclassified Algoriphagus]MEB2779732.1 hypothetical protein [Algoriphagus sp. C2-6-M1]MEB2787027.1 hypothetical protein [Algoriphagus sp. E1-3-M2]